MKSLRHVTLRWQLIRQARLHQRQDRLQRSRRVRRRVTRRPPYINVRRPIEQTVCHGSSCSSYAHYYRLQMVFACVKLLKEKSCAGALSALSAKRRFFFGCPCPPVLGERLNAPRTSNGSLLVSGVRSLQLPRGTDEFKPADCPLSGPNMLSARTCS
jgi:hypothetical protein